MTDYDQDAGELTAPPPRSPPLRSDYPAFRFSSETRLGRGRKYTAQRTDGRPGVHTVTTSDLTELREALTSTGCDQARLFQRACAAFPGMADRSAGVSFSARAIPPLRPPSRPSSTAAGFLPSHGAADAAAPSVASSTTDSASALRSRGRFTDCSGIVPPCRSRAYLEDGGSGKASYLC